VSDVATTDESRRLFESTEVDEFMRGVEHAAEWTGPKPYRRLKLRSRLRLFIYVVSGTLGAIFLLTRPGFDAQTIIPLFAVWVFLGIPACCRLAR
jgi:hypothetical protein